MEIQGINYYTLPEVANMFGVKLLTIYRWRNDGKLSCVKLGGRYLVEETTIKTMLK